MFQKRLSLPFLAIIAIFLAVVLILTTKASTPQKSFDFAPDFSSVQGKLEFNPIEGGFWQIRFGDEDVPYGGKFVLGNDPKLSGFKNGDLVKITGKISPEQVSIFMAGWIYGIEEIKLLR